MRGNLPWQRPLLFFAAAFLVFGLSSVPLSPCTAHAVTDARANQESPRSLLDSQAKATVDGVRKDIQALSVDPTTYKASDRTRVEAVQARFKQLSAKDRKALDAEESHPDTSQPLGRVLELALWAVWSYDEVDNSTTLIDGVYDANSTPVLESEYSKGKSTSPRDRPWSVKEVTVAQGRATATLTVESTSYSGIWMGGKVYPQTNKSGNCEFANVPIDLNKTFYFAGISEIMPVPIAFSLATRIDEAGSMDPAQKELEATREAIAALPAAKSVLGDTGNQAVAAAFAAYDALPDERKAELTDDERLRLAGCVIAVLPKDPFAVTGDHEGAINAAQALFDSLPASLQGELDSANVTPGVSYGRYLESAVWALDALRKVDNGTSLEDGTYTDQVKTTNNWGKYAGEQRYPFKVKSVIVKAGKATALLEHSSETSERLRIGGKEYARMETSPNGSSLFKIPVNLNSTAPFHLSVLDEGATEEDVAKAYELVIEADGSMKPDSTKKANGKDGADSDSSKSKSASGAGAGDDGGSPVVAPSAPQPGGSGGAGATGGTAAAPLNSVLRTNTQSRSSTASSASSGQATPSAKAAGAGASASAATSTSTRASEVNPVSSQNAAPVVTEDLRPAVAGGVLLMLSLGVLVFSLRFVKRESAAL